MVANEVSRLSGVRKSDMREFEYVFSMFTFCVFAYIIYIFLYVYATMAVNATR